MGYKNLIKNSALKELLESELNIWKIRDNKSLLPAKRIKTTSLYEQKTGI